MSYKKWSGGVFLGFPFDTHATNVGPSFHCPSEQEVKQKREYCNLYI